MKIGIDCRSLIHPGIGDAGAGHYTYYLVSELLRRDQSNSYVLYADRSIGKETISRITGGRALVSVKNFPFHSYGHALSPHYSEVLFLAAASRDGIDVLHLPSPFHGEVIPGRTVVTVHDAGIFRHPSWYGKGGNRSGKRISALIGRAARIIAPTKFVKEEITRLIPGAKEKTAVVPHGIDITAHHLWSEDVASPADHLEKEELKGMFGIRDNYLLYIGTIDERRNVAGLLEAFRLLSKREKKLVEGYDLILAGAKGPGADKALLRSAKINRELSGAIKYLGFVTHQAKFGLIEHARAFVYPSRYEGFGFAPLEAAAMGVPVIAGSAAGLKEVLGAAAVFVNPDSARDMALALKKVLESAAERKRLATSGRALAEKYTWKKTAEETLKIYKKVRGA